MGRMNSRAIAEDRHHRELLASTAGGSLEAFGQLYDILYTPLIRFIYRYAQSPATIEEVVNDTMLVVWQKADTFRGESRVITWVLGIARICALKAINRERGWQAEVSEGQENLGSMGGTGRLATKEALDWALAQLSDDHRVAVELAYFHGMTCEEIADVSGCPVNTAKTRLHYARRRLRRVLGDGKQGLELNDFIDEASQ